MARAGARGAHRRRRARPARRGALRPAARRACRPREAGRGDRRLERHRPHARRAPAGRAKAHAAGAQILVDCAQLAPHRAIDMGALDDPRHLDYVALSAHKMYAPFGTGALIGRRDTFDAGRARTPRRRHDRVRLARRGRLGGGARPRRGGHARTSSAPWRWRRRCRRSKRIGMDAVAATRRAHRPNGRCGAWTGSKACGCTATRDPGQAGARLGVITFNLDGLPHGLVAAVLVGGVRHRRAQRLLLRTPVPDAPARAVPGRGARPPQPHGRRRPPRGAGHGAGELRPRTTRSTRSTSSPTRWRRSRRRRYRGDYAAGPRQRRVRPPRLAARPRPRLQPGPVGPYGRMRRRGVSRGSPAAASRRSPASPPA